MEIPRYLSAHSCLLPAGASGSSSSGNRHITTFFTFYDRDRLTPVTLSGKYPVTQFEVFLCRLPLSSPLSHSMISFFCFCYGFSLLKIRNLQVFPYATSVNASSSTSTAFDYFNDRQIELLGKFPVTGIMSRNRHDCTSSVAHQYIIRYPDRNFFSIYRINCRQVRQLQHRFYLLQARFSQNRIFLLPSHGTLQSHPSF